MTYQDSATPSAELRKILIVDDDVSSSYLLKAILERTGKFKALVENESNDALQTCLEFKPDLIFLDIVMPHIEGTTLAYRIHAHPSLQEIPIIYLTGIVPRESSMPHNRLGDFPVILKPVKVEEVFACIETHTQARSVA